MSNILSIIAFAIGVVILPILFAKMIYPELLRRKPSYAFIAAAFFSLIGFLAAFFIFSAALSIAMIAFSSLLLMPFIIKILEEKEMEVPRPTFLSAFRRHDRLILFYAFLFFGMALEYTLLFAILPPSIGDQAFQAQINVIGPSGAFGATELFWGIVINNLFIMFIAFVLSIFWGAGSIFVLSYNASVAGVLYGSAMRALIYGTLPFRSNIIFFLPHTVIEIAAYLLAAVAGGILAKNINDERNIFDAAVLFSIAIAVIFIAGIVEIIVPFSG